MPLVVYRPSSSSWPIESAIPYRVQRDLPRETTWSSSTSCFRVRLNVRRGISGPTRLCTMTGTYFDEDIAQAVIDSIETALGRAIREAVKLQKAANDAGDDAGDEDDDDFEDDEDDVFEDDED